MSKQEKIEKYFNQKDRLNTENKIYSQTLNDILEGIYETDMWEKGDVTTNFVIPNNIKATATAEAGQNGIIAGIEEATWFGKKHDIEIITNKKDGEEVSKGDRLFTMHGSIQNILSIERTMLNLIQRMSGIATKTKLVTDKAGSRVLICSTRKTPWGLIDKKAATLGKGGTHRLGLFDFVLIKDNHMPFFKNNAESIVKNMQDKGLFWEIEVDNENQAFWAADLRPDAIMLDNFKPEKIKQIVSDLQKKYPDTIIEASGGITEDNIDEYSQTGVDVISIGALTNSPKALDIHLHIPSQ